ncbi:type II CAAX endopeptidase family protein [Sphingomicrobium sp. XHP0235]|uniref:CPBP family intramembrane glutamic endopeptidase n=1 Tax=Sphingomicrobium aquimarinum TaxID=3133971 RepID=UPI0031FF11F8
MDGSMKWLVVLLVLLAALGWMTVRDKQDYARFKAAGTTRQRRRFYARWIVTCWLVFGIGGLALLMALGQSDALSTFPTPFATLGLQEASAAAADTSDIWTLVGMAAGFAVGALIAAAIWRMRIRKMRQPVVGDIEPLLPREAGEYPYTGALSVTAGVTEELFFRLALPLLAFKATGSVLLALGIAGAAFGLMHWYQGWAGVVATTLVGAFLTYLYLSSGSLVKPIIVHIVIDLMALVIRPAVATRFASPPTDPASSEALKEGV